MGDGETVGQEPTADRATGTARQAPPGAMPNRDLVRGRCGASARPVRRDISPEVRVGSKTLAGDGRARGMVIDGARAPEQNPAYRPSAHLDPRALPWPERRGQPRDLDDDGSDAVRSADPRAPWDQKGDRADRARDATWTMTAATRSDRRICGPLRPGRRPCRPGPRRDLDDDGGGAVRSADPRAPRDQGGDRADRARVATRPARLASRPRVGPRCGTIESACVARRSEGFGCGRLWRSEAEAAPVATRGGGAEGGGRRRGCASPRAPSKGAVDVMPKVIVHAPVWRLPSVARRVESRAPRRARSHFIGSWPQFIRL